LATGILYQCAVSHAGSKMALPYIGLGTGSPWFYICILVFSIKVLSRLHTAHE